MKPELPIYGLVAMLIAAVSVLAGLQIPVPNDMWILLFGLVAGGLGIAVPASRGATAASVPVAGQIPAAGVLADPFTAPPKGAPSP
jgi:hypothetical protein